MTTTARSTIGIPASSADRAVGRRTAPDAVVEVLAGLALLAVVLGGIGSAFWALVAGLAVRGLFTLAGRRRGA